jgi:predicted nucleotidyltransferase
MTSPSFPSQVHQQVKLQPFPLLFATISGAHLYGFPSADSDYDLRGVHVLPAENVLGLEIGPETIQRSGVFDGVEVDLVSHDAHKFFLMLLKKNGYVLEQLYSPLVVQTTAEHMELKEIARSCITRHHAHHYLGFAETQWKLFEKETPRRVKPLLYVFRVLLTGIWLMKTGLVEANLVMLNESFKLPYLPDLIGRKLAGAEKETLSDTDFDLYQKEYDRLRAALESEYQSSTLPETSAAKPALHELLLRLRTTGPTEK